MADLEEADKPSALNCHTAIKILTQYARLARELNRRLSPERLRDLNLKRDAGIITIDDLPGTLRRVWPGGIFDGKTLDEIRQICGIKK